ncbi:MAG: cytochrome c1 [Xanthomonadales bacterium]|nr:cytochrome c1 [Xanthomonadales bacterium]
MKRIAPRSTLTAVLLLISGTALAAGAKVPLDQAQTDLGNMASIQRGAALYVNYCQGCHSAEYMLYSRLAEDLELTEEQVERNLILTGAKIGEPMVSTMDPADATVWFGAPAPDLSVIARSRGVDWLYTYLRSFYVDPNRPIGWNNTVLANASMPHVLWQLQGIQEPVFETQTDETGVSKEVLVDLKLATPGAQTEAEYDRTIRDLVTYLEYQSEPAKLKRESMGVWVLLYLALFTFLAYLLKLEFWRDVH